MSPETPDPKTPQRGDPPRRDDSRPPGEQPPRTSWTRWLFLAAILALLWSMASSRTPGRELPYSRFKQYLRAGEVETAVVTDQIVHGRIGPAPDGDGGEDGTVARTEGEPQDAFEYHAVRIDDDQLLAQLESKGVEYRGAVDQPGIGYMLLWLLPLLLFPLLILFLMRARGGGGGMGGPMGSPFGFGRSRAKMHVDKDTGVTFDDVAGCDEAKTDLSEVVSFLKQPERFAKLGAKVPKGVLLLGPPGTGKTLMSRAVAGEAGVPFYSISGSEFVEMFVGVGAARVRDLFEQAKKSAPCIIFVDEIDAIGRARGVQIGAVNDEREQTLNQLLVEMDGFEPNSGVILLAATNRPDVLDRALLRPGRFDRQVVLDAPDAKGREAILQVHARGKPLADDVDLQQIARGTPGFAGADLANALNEAALLASRRGASEVSQRDMEEAIEKIVAGPERQTRRLRDSERRRVAFHETGHALVAWLSEFADPVHKISIVPRGRAALGYTMQLPLEEQYLATEQELMDRMSVLLAGRAAEFEVFGNVSTGASDDLDRATRMAREMVCVYGMGESVGLMRCAQDPESALLRGPGARMQRDCSEQTARDIDSEVRKLLDTCYARASGMLREHRAQLDRVAETLLERERLDQHEFEELLG